MSKIDTSLNTWLKSLPKDQKKTFHRNMLKSALIWDESKEKTQKRWVFNNYRKEGYIKESVPHAIKMQIYVCALSVDPEIKVETIFPDVSQDYIDKYIPIMKVLAENLTNF